MRTLQLAVNNGNAVTERPERPERRRNLRISMPFPVRVRGIAGNGEREEFESEIRNLSAGGLFLHTRYNLGEWKRLFFVLRLSLDSNPANPAPLVAARGEVVRMQPGPGDCPGYAVALRSHKFI